MWQLCHRNKYEFCTLSHQKIVFIETKRNSSRFWHEYLTVDINQTMKSLSMSMKFILLLKLTYGFQFNLDPCVDWQQPADWILKYLIVSGLYHINFKNSHSHDNVVRRKSNKINVCLLRVLIVRMSTSKHFTKTFPESVRKPPNNYRWFKVNWPLKAID